jgi:protein TonB
MLVQTTQIADESSHIIDNPKPAIPEQPVRTPTISHAKRTTPHATSSSEHNPLLESQTATPVEPEFQPDIASSVPSSKESPTASISEPHPSVDSQTSDPPLLQAATPFESPTQEPPRPVTAAAAAPTEENTPSADATQPLPTPTTASDFAAVFAIQADYGWLQQAIFRRLEELKRSSRPLLDRSRPLKVLVRAVVSNEGTLLDAEVVKSSGLDRIDQEAMALVQRAFPMQLDRPLDRQQMAMRIPITYSRE